jgi:hypothetical protein
MTSLENLDKIVHNNPNNNNNYNPKYSLVNNENTNKQLHPCLDTKYKPIPKYPVQNQSKTAIYFQNERMEQEKMKFFNILKSLFAIFDPECTGSIDVNELDKFSGKNNEILKDVLNFIRNDGQDEKFCSNLKNYKKLRQNENNNNSRLISFDEFVKAAEITLNQRKQSKMLTNIENLNPNRHDTTTQSLPPLLFSSSSSSATGTCSSSSSTPSSPTTLSQAFETATINNSSKAEKSSSIKKSQTSDCIQSYDLKSLIDKENLMLREGLEHIDCIKKFYLNQLVENRLKISNINKLKHQNLFSIDRMLLDVQKLNDFNKSLQEFLKQNRVLNEEDKEHFSGGCNRVFDDLLQTGNFDFSNLGNAQNNVELDDYLKEKQERIEMLQKEKSQLIRKLFEMKSESEKINKNLLKLQTNKSQEIMMNRNNMNDTMYDKMNNKS